ncbi:acyl-CoA dehydrogenase family protein [Streptacidiphilus rugosus]|uniref:acyl-CoA dehydrogenase family protein n=1 Tax=Streptacidiphilus rugosus TaxID=405783 RepID=UPI00068A0898|nr:acyl-CoA dehydrogenase family protein [Streptacidiphilus rugosus]
MVTIAPGLLSAAELLTAHVRPRAEAVEERCRLDDVTATEISDAGFPAHFVPAVHGGRAGTFTELVRAVTELGEGCTSTAWCAALFAAHGRLASYLPERGRAAVWARGAQTRIAAAVVPPQGSAVAVSGGWQLSGRWTPASGVDHAQWILLASRTGDQHRIFAVPVRRCTILSTWDHVGLRGSGSNSVELDGVFVPSWSTMTLDDLARPHRDPDAARCHRVPFPLVAGLMFAAPALGAAQAAVADVVAALRQRSAAGPARPARVRRPRWRRPRPRCGVRGCCCSARQAAPTRER